MIVVDEVNSRTIVSQGLSLSNLFYPGWLLRILISREKSRPNLASQREVGCAEVLKPAEGAYHETAVRHMANSCLTTQYNDKVPTIIDRE